MPNESPQLESAPFLFSKQTIQALTEAERRGEYTLERTRQLRPELIDEVINLRSQLIGQLRIAKILGVHHRTVAAIDQEYPEEIAIARKKRISKLNSTADNILETVADNPEAIPPNVRCLAASQLYDKAELLAGGPTLRVQIGGKIDIPTQLRNLLDEARAIREATLRECAVVDDENCIDMEPVKNAGYVFSDTTSDTTSDTLPETGVAAGKSLAIIDPIIASPSFQPEPGED
jgi:hypothetical protein